MSAEIKWKNPKGLYTYPLNTKKTQVREYRNEISHIPPQYILFWALPFNPHAHNLDSEPHHFQFTSFHHLLTGLQDSKFYPSHPHIFQSTHHALEWATWKIILFLAKLSFTTLLLFTIPQHLLWGQYYLDTETKDITGKVCTDQYPIQYRCKSP